MNVSSVPLMNVFLFISFNFIKLIGCNSCCWFHIDVFVVGVVVTHYTCFVSVDCCNFTASVITVNCCACIHLKYLINNLYSIKRIVNYCNYGMVNIILMPCIIPTFQNY